MNNGQQKANGNGNEPAAAGLCLIGCGAQARYGLEILRHLPPRNVVLVDPIGRGPRQVEGLPVERAGDLGQIAGLMRDHDLGTFHVVIADHDRKLELIDGLIARGFPPASLIHPAAIIAATATIEPGCLINPSAVIGPGTVIARGALLHSLVNVDHDCVLAPCVNLAPGVTLAGRVRVAAKAFIYTGASVAPDVTIGEAAIVGAGACVLHDVAAGSTVVGIPARPVRQQG